MIYHVVSGKVPSGREEEAIAWLKKLAEHSNQINPRAVVEITRRLDGPVNEYSWVGKLESLAAHEEGGKVFQVDPQTQAIMKEGEGLFTDVRQHFYEIL
jgi:hypothetical protein